MMTAYVLHPFDFGVGAEGWRAAIAGYSKQALISSSIIRAGEVWKKSRGLYSL